MKFKRLLKVLAFALIFVLVFSTASFYFKNNSLHDQLRIMGFYQEPKDSIDVLFLGGCQSSAQVIAPLVWKQKEITCYSIGTTSQPFSIIKSKLIESLKTDRKSVV